MYRLNEQKATELTSTFPVFKTLVTLGMAYDFLTMLLKAPRKRFQGMGRRHRAVPELPASRRKLLAAQPGWVGGPGASFMCKRARRLTARRR